MGKKKNSEKRKWLVESKTDRAKMERFKAVSSLLERYDSGRATPAEKRLVEELEKTDDGHLLEIGSDDILSDTEREDINLRVYSRVADKLDFLENDWQEVLAADASIRERAGVPVMPVVVTSWHHTLARHLRVYGSVAAVIAVVVFIAASLFQKGTVLKADNEILASLLPDSTNVVINQDSRLVISGDFGEDFRRVEMEGEIFFDVAKNPRKPFLISHGLLQTLVKGTSFTVCDYPGVTYSSITVRTGVVSVSREGKRLAELRPGDRLVFDKETGSYSVSRVDWESSSAWIHGDVILEDAGPDELALRLNQNYKGRYKISIRDGTFSDGMRFNTRFGHDDDIRTVLNRLQTVYGIRYVINGDRVTVFK